MTEITDALDAGNLFEFNAGRLWISATSTLGSPDGQAHAAAFAITDAGAIERMTELRTSESRIGPDRRPVFDIVDATVIDSYAVSGNIAVTFQSVGSSDQGDIENMNLVSSSGDIILSRRVGEEIILNDDIYTLVRDVLLGDALFEHFDGSNGSRISGSSIINDVSFINDFTVFQNSGHISIRGQIIRFESDGQKSALLPDDAFRSGAVGRLGTFGDSIYFEGDERRDGDAGNELYKLNNGVASLAVDLTVGTGSSAIFDFLGVFDTGDAGGTFFASVNDDPTGAVTIAGAAAEDQVLTADTTSIADADGLGPFSFQWQRDGVDIVGTIAATYTLVDADVGRTVRVVVSYTDGFGTDEALTSAATAPIANVPDAPTGVPVIVGAPGQNQTLAVDTAVIADGDGLGAFAFQWQRGGVDIAGATASTFLLGSADLDQELRVVVSYTDGHGANEAVTSASILNDNAGTEGDDSLIGGVGRDLLDGAGGDDRVTGGAGGDLLRGGSGVNIVDYSRETGPHGVIVDLATGAATDSFGDVDALSGFQNVFGSHDADSLRGDDVGNILAGRGGDDILLGRAGNDELHGNVGDDTLQGMVGDDLLNGGAGIDTAHYGGAAGLVGINLTNGTAQDGDGGSDTLISIENVIGTGFNDVLIGDAFANTLTGGGGFDRLDGRGGDDRMEGGAGNDIYTVTDIGDVVIEGANEGTKDRINVFVDFTNPENVEFLVGLFANRGLVLTGSEGRESITGANKINSPDTIDGRGGNDRIVGMVGDDVIEGGAGDDRIFGNSGHDTLVGGTGADRLTGQFGNDLFVFRRGDGADRITDFNQQGDDRIDLTDFGTDFAAVQRQMTAQGADILINLLNGDSILLEGIGLSPITSGDFIL